MRLKKLKPLLLIPKRDGRFHMTVFMFEDGRTCTEGYHIRSALNRLALSWGRTVPLLKQHRKSQPLVYDDHFIMMPLPFSPLAPVTGYVRVGAIDRAGKFNEKESFILVRKKIIPVKMKFPYFIVYLSSWYDAFDENLVIGSRRSVRKYTVFREEDRQVSFS